jgi:hypothetical protein
LAAPISHKAVLQQLQQSEVLVFFLGFFSFAKFFGLANYLNISTFFLIPF